MADLELYGYAITAEGLCNDGRYGSMTRQMPMVYIDKVNHPWLYLASEFNHIQHSLLHFHPDLDPKKLKWKVEGMWRVKPEVYRRELPPKLPTGELTAGELARLP